MPTLLVSTIPRSGTWHLKYFFRFLADYAARREPVIEKVFRDVNDAQETAYLGDMGIVTTRIDHFPFPGAHFLPDRAHPAVKMLKGLSARLDRQQFETDANIVIAALEPKERGQRCLLVHRNIFDQFASTTFRQSRKVPNWPVDLSVAKGSSVAASFEAMAETNVCEAYAAQVLGFKIGASLYPDRVRIFSYEDVILGGSAAKRRLLDFIGLACSDDVLARSCDAVSKARMLEYERRLGRALSGGVSQHRSHISDNRPGLYREHLTPGVARRIKRRLEELDIADVIWRPEDDALLVGGNG